VTRRLLARRQRIGAFAARANLLFERQADTAQLLRELAQGVDPDNHLRLREHLLAAAHACDALSVVSQRLDEAHARIAALTLAGRDFLRVARSSGVSWDELEQAAEQFLAVLNVGGGAGGGGA
jgi:hypothetical protein